MPMRFHIESLESYPNLPTILGWFNRSTQGTSIGNHQVIQGYAHKNLTMGNDHRDSTKSPIFCRYY